MHNYSGLEGRYTITLSSSSPKRGPSIREQWLGYRSLPATPVFTGFAFAGTTEGDDGKDYDAVVEALR